MVEGNSNPVKKKINLQDMEDKKGEVLSMNHQFAIPSS